ncbi:MAG TPA: hypothetical protein VNQ80_00940, partial [Parapedobacter sp.]|uniref:hypothetical protein n=1 Tax=Parapedobacter sp. TaxID=1958893 RepID=UPI002CAF67D6
MRIRKVVTFVALFVGLYPSLSYTQDLQIDINNTPNGGTLTLSATTYPISTALVIPDNKTITIRGAGAGITTIQQTSTNQRVFTVGQTDNQGATLILEDLTITGGDVRNGEGGGIFIHEGWDVTLNRMEVKGNTASGSSAILNTKFNLADRAAGGGIFNNGSNLTLNNSIISENTADGTVLHGNGGGIYSLKGLLKINASTISNNYAKGVAPTLEPLFVGSSDSRGGGIHSNGGKLILMDSEVSGNKSDSHGGGIFLEGRSAIGVPVVVGLGEGIIINSVIKENIARENPYSHRGEGGGIHVFVYASLIMYGGEVQHNTVRGFQSGYASGAVYRHGGGVHLQQTAVTPEGQEPAVRAVFRMVKFEGNEIDDNFSGPAGGSGEDIGLPEGLNHHVGNLRNNADVKMELNHWGDENGPQPAVERCETGDCAVDLTLGFSGTGQGAVSIAHNAAGDPIFDGILQALADAEYNGLTTKGAQFSSIIGLNDGAALQSSNGEQTLSLPYMANIRLSAAAQGISTFGGWDDNPANTTPMNLTMDDDKDVTASFSPGPAHTVTLTGPTEGTAGIASDEFTLTVVDADGNTKAVSTDTEFGLSSNGDGEPTFDPLSPVTVSAGSASVTFSYENTKAGDYTITATRQSGETLPGGGSDEVDITIMAGSISVGPNGTLLSVDETERIAGVEIATVGVQLKDTYGNNIHQPDVEIVFTATHGLLDNGGDPAAAVVTVSTDANGLATATLASSLAGEAEVTATVPIEGTATPVSNGSPVTIEFVAGAASVGTTTITAASGSITTDGSTLVTVQLKDANGNNLGVSSGTVL